MGDGGLSLSSGVNLTGAVGTFDVSGATAGTDIATLSGATGSSVVLGDRTLTLTNLSTTYGGVIGGNDGALSLATGTQTLTGDNTYAVGTTVTGGTLQLGDGSTAGTIIGDVANAGLMVFQRADKMNFNGAISGTGGVLQAGTGTTVFGGAHTYSGATTVARGALEAGAANIFSTFSVQFVLSGSELHLADSNQTVAALDNAGRVVLGGTPGTTLRVSGDYVGNGGVLGIATELGDDYSATDRLEVGGNTSGTTLIEITNDGGTGAVTVEGIRVLEVGGLSAGQFLLAGDYVIAGQQAVVAGAYAYTLRQNGIAPPSAGHWYHRSSLFGDPGSRRPSRPARQSMRRIRGRCWRSTACRRCSSAWVQDTENGVLVAGLTFQYGKADTNVSSF